MDLKGARGGGSVQRDLARFGTGPFQGSSCSCGAVLHGMVTQDQARCNRGWNALFLMGLI